MTLKGLAPALVNGWQDVGKGSRLANSRD